MARLGFTDAALRAALDAVGSGDPERVAADDPDCTQPLSSFKAFAAATNGSPPYAAVSIAPLRDMGCLLGTSGRFANAVEALCWVQTAPSRGRDTESAGGVAGFTDLPARLPPEGGEVPSFTVHSMLSGYYSGLVLPLCVSDPAVGAG